VRGSGLLRFARNDVGETGVRLPAAEFARVLLTITLSESRGSREGRVAAAPGAPAQRKFARAREPQVQTVTTGLPCAVVYGLYELSSVNHPVCHRRPRDAQASSRTWRRTLGRQDHTTSPSVNESRSSDSTFTSTASPPHVRDVRDTPSATRRDTGMIADFQKIAIGIFLLPDLEAVSPFDSVRQISIRAHDKSQVSWRISPRDQEDIDRFCPSGESILPRACTGVNRIPARPRRGRRGRAGGRSRLQAQPHCIAAILI